MAFITLCMVYYQYSWAINTNLIHTHWYVNWDIPIYLRVSLLDFVILIPALQPQCTKCSNSRKSSFPTRCSSCISQWDGGQCRETTTLLSHVLHHACSSTAHRKQHQIWEWVQSPFHGSNIEMYMSRFSDLIPVTVFSILKKTVLHLWYDLFLKIVCFLSIIFEISGVIKIYTFLSECGSKQAEPDRFRELCGGEGRKQLWSLPRWAWKLYHSQSQQT